MKHADGTAKRINQRRALLWGFVLVIMTVAFQNCGRFETNPLMTTSSASLATGGAELQPATDRTSSSCLTDPAFDACLFRKNPVAARKQPFLGTPGVSETLETAQTYGVKLTGLSANGRLENATIKIETTRGTPVTYESGNMRFKAQNDGLQRVPQLMAYYWMTRAREYIEARTGVFPARDKSIRVFVDDTIAGWAPASNSIHLRIASSGNHMGWNGDLAVHFLGLASLHYASGGSINDLSESTHRTCGLATNGCCTAATGCARAIMSGVGDYFAAMIFPDQPSVGETWANRVEGIALCMVNRDLERSSQVSVQTAFDSCGTEGRGEASSLGTIYASIWWNVRKAAGRQTNGDRDIDTLFMHHLSLLNGDDDFSTALVKIKSVDSRLFDGKYASLFDAQYLARGL